MSGAFASFASGGTNVPPSSNADLKRSAVTANWLGCAGPDSLSSESSTDVARRVLGTLSLEASDM